MALSVASLTTYKQLPLELPYVEWLQALLKDVQASPQLSSAADLDLELACSHLER